MSELGSEIQMCLNKETMVSLCHPLKFTSLSNFALLTTAQGARYSRPILALFVLWHNELDFVPSEPESPNLELQG